MPARAEFTRQRSAAPGELHSSISQSHRRFMRAGHRRRDARRAAWKPPSMWLGTLHEVSSRRLTTAS